ncbi:hypothetical protein A2W24_01045 [Microgenomates group bacterium RBG_16_45_19]|nr:MAG: hypothetical protein A2W24_01045 [Microgenomates group bacterium RBG_16_45_19]
MDTLVLQFLIPIISGVIISIITALLTVHLSLRRFYSEKWWERKAEAYSNIVEALYVVRMNQQAVLTALESGQEFPDEEYDILAKRARSAQSEIVKVTSIGAFIISQDASDALDRLARALQEAQNEPALYSVIDFELAAIKQAITDIRDIAKRELKYR